MSFLYTTKMINPGSTRNENNKEHNEKWPFISHHSYRILIIWGSGSGKINALLDLIKEQDDIDTIYLYAKDSSEPKYEFLIKSAKLSSLEIYKILQLIILQTLITKIYREWIRKPYSFLIIDTTLSASKPLRFRKNLLPSYKNDSNWSD